MYNDDPLDKAFWFNLGICVGYGLYALQQRLQKYILDRKPTIQPRARNE